MRETSDVVRLGPLTEGELARVLRRRFVRDHIYTGAGGALLALNPGPGRALPLYTARAAREYVVAGAGDYLEPHVYSVAAAAYRDARDDRATPLVLVTGVSGAGKTEAARLVLQCVLVAGAGGGAGSRLAAAGTLLEAAGHAATSLNHNASRFARLLDVQLDASGGVAGGSTSHFLLEKGRVARVPPGERNFHMFYQLLAGADGALLGSLKLRGAPHVYRVLRAGGAATSPESQRAADAAHFAFTRAALHTLGVTGARESGVWRALSFVLKLGEAEFTPSLNIDGSVGARLLDPREVIEACELVGVDPAVLLREWGVGDAEWCCGVGGDAEWARAARDRLLGVVYERVFGWLVRAANEAVRSDLRARLTIVDVYGFETLAHNGLERLLINYAAESVHLAARDLVLRGAAEAARDDGAELAGTRVHDAERPGAGEVALAVLRAAARAAGECEYVTLLEAAVRARDERLRPLPPHGFLVRHFAGRVEYDAKELLREENAGLLMGAGAMAAARDPLLGELFAGESGRSPRRPDSPGGRQRALVGALCRRLREGCGTRLVHCLLADGQRRPRVFDEELVLHQLYTQGIAEMVAARRDGYCEWMSAGDLVARYGALSAGGTRDLTTGVSAARTLLSSLPLQGTQFAFGRSLVFVRSERTLHLLETWRRARQARAACTIQRAWRRRRARLERAARVLQMRWRERAGGAVARALRDRAAAVLCRLCVRRVRQQYLRDLRDRLPAAHVSPLWSAWPAPPQPRLTARTDLLLRELHHRWRCRVYRASFDQTARNRMREKVTASALFRDRKTGYSRSVGHPFVGDYVRLRASAEWLRRGGRDGYVVFADMGGRVCRASGRVLPALLVLTTTALLVLEPRSLRARRRLPAVELRRLALSPADDGLLVVSGRPTDTAEGCGGGATGGRGRGDLVLETRHALELATKLFLVGQNAAGRAPLVLVAPRFEADFGDQLVTVSFHVAGGGAGGAAPRLVRSGSRLDVLL